MALSTLNPTWYALGAGYTVSRPPRPRLERRLSTFEHGTASGAVVCSCGYPIATLFSFYLFSFCLDETSFYSRILLLCVKDLCLVGLRGGYEGL